MAKRTYIPLTVLVLVIAAALYYFFFFTNHSGQATANTASTTKTVDTSPNKPVTNATAQPDLQTSLIYSVPLTTPVDTSNWSTYSNPILGFSVKYPPQTTYSTSTVADFKVVSFDLSKAVNGDQFSKFSIQIFSGKTNLNQWVSSDEAVRQAPQPLVQKSITIGGEPAEYLGYSNYDSDSFGIGNYVEIVMYVVHNGMGYRISGVASPGANEADNSSAIGKYEGYFKSMLDSLNFN